MGQKWPLAFMLASVRSIAFLHGLVLRHYAAFEAVGDVLSDAHVHHLVKKVLCVTCHFDGRTISNAGRSSVVEGESECYSSNGTLILSVFFGKAGQIIL